METTINNSIWISRANSVVDSTRDVLELRSSHVVDSRESEILNLEEYQSDIESSSAMSGASGPRLVYIPRPATLKRKSSDRLHSGNE